MTAGFDPDRHHRRSIRLKGYDYRQAGAYFVTICTHDRACLFGEVVNDSMRLNEVGQIVQTAWHDLPAHYPHVCLDAFVIMPNHVHGIVVLTEGPGVVGAGLTEAGSTVGAGFKPAPTTDVKPDVKPAPTDTSDVPAKRHGLSEIVRAFKTFSARGVNGIRQTPGAAVWQRNYYEHIVRDEFELDRIRQYIVDNPGRWAEDPEHPARQSDKRVEA